MKYISKLLIILLTTLTLLLTVIFLTDLIMNKIKPSVYETDEILGWKVKKNFDYVFTQSDLNGKEYKSHFYTNDEGLRYNKTKKKYKKKVLILGDSFVMDPYVSNSNMWYQTAFNKINEKIGKDIYLVEAAGGGGYSSFQEFLVLRKLLKKKVYDIFVLQLCSNDFKSNSISEEYFSGDLNQAFRRPYTNFDNEIFYNQKFIAKFYRSKLLSSSRFFSYFNNQLMYIPNLILNNFFKNSDQNFIKKIDPIDITNKILKDMIELFEQSQTQFFLTNCDSNMDTFNKYWKKIGQTNRFVVLNKSIEKFDLIKKNDDLYKDGSHWSESGNYLFGSLFFDEIKHYLIK